MMDVWFVSFKQLKKKLIILLIFTGIIIIMGLFATKMIETFLEGDELKLKIVLVNEDQSDEMETISSLVLTSKEVTEKFEIIYEEDRTVATEMVQENQVVAAIIFPEGFIYSVINGINESPIIIMNESVGLEQEFMEHMIVVLEDVMRSTQSGIYTILEEAQEHVGEDSEIVYDANIAYVRYILNRDNLFHVEQIEYVEAISLFDYYAVTLCIYLLFLSTTLFYQELSLYHERKVQKQIRSMNWQVGYGLFWNKVGILVVIYAVVLGGVSWLLNAEFSMLFCIAVMLSSSMMILFQVLMFHVISEFSVSVSVNFLLHTIFLFVIGGAVPSIYLPDFFEQLSFLTPIYYIQTMMLGGHTVVNDTVGICVVAGTLNVFLFAAIEWRTRYILKEI